MDDLKKRVQNACEKYHKKMLRQQNPNKRKNNSPEKDFIKDQLLPWLRENDFDCQVVESKAVYNDKAGRYLHGQTYSGFCDIVGNDKYGVACYIEAKAPSHRNVIFNEKHQHQLDFLRRKIRSRCFAVCTDDVNELGIWYRQFIYYKKKGAHNQAVSYLLKILAKK